MKLGALLDAHWPGAKAIFVRLDSPIALAFLRRYPMPQAAERLERAAWPRPAGAIPTAATAARRRCWPGCGPPRVAVNSLDRKVLAACVSAQVQLLRALLASIANLDRVLLAASGAHTKTAVLAAMPRIGQVNLAQIVAEVGPILDHANDREHAAAEAGASPVTKQSGKATSVYVRWAANTRPRRPWPPLPATAATAPPGLPRCTARPAGEESATLRHSGS